MTLYGCEMTPGCMDGGGGGGGGDTSATPTDPNPKAAGYWMGTTVTPGTCYSASGAGISDVDLDGLSDYCENLLAYRFRPSLSVSQYDCSIGGEPYYAAKWFPSHDAVRIVYAFAYYQDCGAHQTAGLDCALGSFFGPLLTLNGVLPNWTLPIPIPGYGFIPITDEDLCASHRGDSEFITVDLNFDGTSQHWYVGQAFMASHWFDSGDHSHLVATDGLEYPEHYGGYPRVWVAEDKHGSFPTRYACDNEGGARRQL